MGELLATAGDAALESWPRWVARCCFEWAGGGLGVRLGCWAPRRQAPKVLTAVSAPLRGGVAPVAGCRAPVHLVAAGQSSAEASSAPCCCWPGSIKAGATGAHPSRTPPCARLQRARAQLPAGGLPGRLAGGGHLRLPGASAADRHPGHGGAAVGGAVLGAVRLRHVWASWIRRLRAQCPVAHRPDKPQVRGAAGPCRRSTSTRSPLAPLRTDPAGPQRRQPVLHRAAGAGAGLPQPG